MRELFPLPAGLNPELVKMVEYQEQQKRAMYERIGISYRKNRIKRKKKK